MKHYAGWQSLRSGESSLLSEILKFRHGKGLTCQSLNRDLSYVISAMEIKVKKRPRKAVDILPEKV